MRRLRRRIWPVLDAALSVAGGYATSTIDDEGYVGTVELDLRDVEDRLASQGYGFEVVSALKHRSCPDGPEVEAGSWVWRKSKLSSHQLHAHLFSTVDEPLTDVYAHHEPSWLTRPLKHYRADSCDCSRGAEMVGETLAEEGLELFHRPHEERCEI